MEQEHIMFGNYTPPDVDEDGYTPQMATTSSSNSGRTSRGVAKNVVLFTTEAYQLKWTNISAQDAAKILAEVVNKPEFDFHYYSVYLARWQTKKFYAANYSPKISSLVKGQETLDELSFQVTRIDPL